MKRKEIAFGIKYQRIFTFPATKPSYIDQFIFTGIKGQYYQRIKFKIDKERQWDSNPEGKFEDFELLSKMILETDPVYFPFT